MGITEYVSSSVEKEYNVSNFSLEKILEYMTSLWTEHRDITMIVNQEGAEKFLATCEIVHKKIKNKNSKERIYKKHRDTLTKGNYMLRNGKLIKL